MELLRHALVYATSATDEETCIISARSVGPGAPRRPMPDEAELERCFNEVLMQMDLPPDRAKLLKSFDNAKKWDIICDREQVRERPWPVLP